MDLTDFRINYPEFRNVADEQVESYLTQAGTQLSQAVIGNQYDLMHGLKTADLIARSPGGVNARLLAKDGTTTYGNAYDKLKHSIGVAGVMAV